MFPMVKYMLRYTTPYGVQFVQEFDSEEDRNNAFMSIGSTKRIYGNGSLVIVSDNIVCIEPINENVENTVEDFTGEKDG